MPNFIHGYSTTDYKALGSNLREKVLMYSPKIRVIKSWAKKQGMVLGWSQNGDGLSSGWSFIGPWWVWQWEERPVVAQHLLSQSHWVYPILCWGGTGTARPSTESWFFAGVEQVQQDPAMRADESPAQTSKSIFWNLSLCLFMLMNPWWKNHTPFDLTHLLYFGGGLNERFHCISLELSLCDCIIIRLGEVTS